MLVTITWIFILLLKAGDIEQNPGPSTGSSISSANSSSSASGAWNLSSLPNQLSVVHYNVQSIARKIDILSSELFEFDILAFSETWLNPSIPNANLLIQSYKEPERKDRHGDSHGGVMIYIKDLIYYRRRLDLEPKGIECI
ncbi:MAG: endonuclease/exonuclease/phosphatase family protein, partial [Candidatus Thiodiazotropha taylori]|nr:endonuclease/exonuclease/phosphatase family protein [Candidatus Thiodiazotropha taylori]MCW4306999.1 endonuclease/exonuclease/phosphatase family protein [Candidatus Thiodiazotropha endolucinida]